MEHLMEIDEWLEHYRYARIVWSFYNPSVLCLLCFLLFLSKRLSPEIEQVLLSFGIEVIEDVDALFKDEELLKKCKSFMSNEDFTNFAAAYNQYSAARNEGDASSVSSESWAKIGSHSSSVSSAPEKKLMGMTLSDSIEKNAKQEHDAKHDKRNRRISGKVVIFVACNQIEAM